MGVSSDIVKDRGLLKTILDKGRLVSKSIHNEALKVCAQKGYAFSAAEQAHISHIDYMHYQGHFCPTDEASILGGDK